MAARYEEAIATARAAKDDWALGLALNGYSSSGPVRADPKRARPMVEEALSLFRRIGDAAGTAHAASTLGEIAMDAGDLEVAERLISDSIESAREIDNRPPLAFGLLVRSIISLLRDDVEEADAHLQAAIQMSTPYDDREMAADALSTAGAIAAMRQEPPRRDAVGRRRNLARFRPRARGRRPAPRAMATRGALESHRSGNLGRRHLCRRRTHAGRRARASRQLYLDRRRT